ncbi:hypothetical protein FACS189468_6580 [Spirochaetia bacterium]|nr:hypothetical protein FACS189468_6580 [Spirochaetia bacterium]
MINLCNDRNHYYRQTNNKIDPTISCQCTSLIAGFDVVYKGDVGILEKLGTYKQPEDNLRNFTAHDPEILAFCRKSHPGSKLPPSEWADVLVYAANKVYGKRVVYFEGNITPQVLISDLEKGLPVMVSLRFPEHNIPGHYILVVGEKEGNFIINDPFKNFLTGDWDGFNCLYSAADWKTHSKGYGIRFIRA